MSRSNRRAARTAHDGCSFLPWLDARSALPLQGQYRAVYLQAEVRCKSRQAEAVM